jgi:hypothetical protein
VVRHVPSNWRAALKAEGDSTSAASGFTRSDLSLAVSSGRGAGVGVALGEDVSGISEIGAGARCAVINNSSHIPLISRIRFMARLSKMQFTAL